MDRDQDLIDAAKDGDVQKVEDLLNKGVDIEAKSKRITDVS